MARKVALVKNQYYHVYNRGVNLQNIFFCQENWTFFLHRLRRYFTHDRADIIAYCLMPNHYHLMVLAKTEQFGKEVMQPLTVSYTKAVNKQQDRVGPLFQGPFQAKLIGDDRYLRHLSRYIHLNPVMAGLVKQPENWEYSSYREFVGLRKGTLPNPQVIWEQISIPKPRNGVFDKNSVSEQQQAYADFVSSLIDHRAGLTVSLFFDE